MKAIDMPVPDLTLLAEQKGGLFPRAAVERCIRETVRPPSPENGLDMPVWTAPPSSNSDAGPAPRAQTIATYIESLQRRSR